MAKQGEESSGYFPSADVTSLGLPDVASTSDPALATHPEETNQEQECPNGEAQWVAESLECKQGDLALLDKLTTTGFTGPEWDRFVHGLACYGHAVVLAWLRSGEMFTQCRKKMCWPGHPPAAWRDEDRVSLANDTVFQAIIDFRERGLRGGGWRPDGGASMKSYFIGTCVLAFPNIYRKWRNEDAKWCDVASGTEDIAGLSSSDEDPSELAVQRIYLECGLASVPDDRTKKAIILQEMGYTYEEIAALLGVTAGAVKEILARQRRRGRKASHDGGPHA